jgi:hypothetical protein
MKPLQGNGSCPKSLRSSQGFIKNENVVAAGAIMNRTTRAVCAFVFGATLVVGSTVLLVFANEVGDQLASFRGRLALTAPEREYYVLFAGCLLLGGLIIEGFALLGWIIAPRDGRP